MEYVENSRFFDKPALRGVQPFNWADETLKALRQRENVALAMKLSMELSRAEAHPYWLQCSAAPRLMFQSRMFSMVRRRLSILSRLQPTEEEGEGD